MITDNTDLVAWWGAIIGTFVLTWDIAKWFSSGPKVRCRVLVNIHYFDGETEPDSSPGDSGQRKKAYCHIELVNRGKMPTTIMDISATHSGLADGAAKVTSTQLAFTPHFGVRLPTVLAPGEVWSCRLPMSHYENLKSYGRPEFVIQLSHKNRPLRIKRLKDASSGKKVVG